MMRTVRRVHALHVGVLALVLRIAVVEANRHNNTALGLHADDCGHGHGDDGREISRSEALVVMAMIVLMIQLSMVFEAGREAMKDHAGVELVDMVHALFSELALLGFIGFLAFVTVRIGLGEMLSKVLGIPHFVHLLEDVHMGLFAVMVTFILFVVYLVSHAKGNYEIWAHAEAAINLESRGGTVRPFQRHLDRYLPLRCLKTKIYTFDIHFDHMVCIYMVRRRYRTAALPLLLIGDRRSLRVVQYDRLKARFLHFVSTRENLRSPLPRLDRRFDMAWYVLCRMYSIRLRLVFVPCILSVFRPSQVAPESGSKALEPDCVPKLWSQIGKQSRFPVTP